MSSPRSTERGAPVTVTSRSASRGGVYAKAVLFFGSGSAFAAATRALLVYGVRTGGDCVRIRATRVKRAAAPAARRGAVASWIGIGEGSTGTVVQPSGAANETTLLGTGKTSRSLTLNASS